MQDSSIVLSNEEHHHLSKVVRSKPNDKVWLFDEEGTKYLAIIEKIEKEKTILHILERKGKEKDKTIITLAQALVRSKQMDFILRAATELGISTFIPVITARSIVKIEKETARKVDRWIKIARESSKQCKSGLVPRILPPLPLRNFLQQVSEAKKFYLSENRGTFLRDILIANPGSQAQILSFHVIILTGPEGGWTEEEEAMIERNGYEAISLGKNILRAETAALSAVAILSHFWKW